MDAKEVLNQARDAMTVKRVFGDPYEQDGLTVIPVANVLGVRAPAAARGRSPACRHRRRGSCARR